MFFFFKKEKSSPGISLVGRGLTGEDSGKEEQNYKHD